MSIVSKLHVTSLPNFRPPTNHSALIIRQFLLVALGLFLL